MKTADLIARLSADLAPTPAGLSARRLGWPVLAGLMAAVVMVLLGLGFRPMGEAVVTWPFWMKVSYTSLLSVAGLMMAFRASRPGLRISAALWPALAAWLLIAALAGQEFFAAAPDHLLALWLGGSWNVCPIRILVFSIPVYLGAVLGMRRLAPTRPVAAGAAAGFAAGALGAAAYQLACPETGAMFVATWYSLGVLLATVVGAAIGSVALRWTPWR